MMDIKKLYSTYKSGILFSKLLGCLILILCNATCQHTSHNTLRDTAQSDWNRVRARYKMNMAKQKFENGRVEEAISIVQDAARLDSQQSIYFRSLATYQLELGNIEKSQQAIDHAKTLGDETPELAYIEGILAERQLDTVKALELFRKAVDLNPANVDYILATTETLVEFNMLESAIDFLDGKISAVIDRCPLLILRARIHVLQNDLGAAIRDFSWAKEILSDSRWLDEEFGILLERAGRFSEAVAIIEPLIESTYATTDTNSDDMIISSTAIRSLASSYNRLHKPTQTRELLEKHLSQNAEDSRSWWLLAECNILLAQWDRVEQCIREGESVSRHSVNWGILKAYLSLQQGDVEQTKSLLKTVMSDPAQNPNTAAMAHILSGRVYEKTNELNQSRKHFEAAQKIVSNFSANSNR